MHLTIINGPNLNLLGTREPEIYGSRSFESFLEELKTRFPAVRFDYFQSNGEGALIDRIQACMGRTDGIIFNGAGYTHTSIAIADALAAAAVPTVEVHISNIHARESFRQHSYTGAKAIGVITGLGLEGYALAVQYLLDALQKEKN
ncbi:type II 3-dehydroquinate dehydratase [Taibaiella helva]|uniref:type II 3-dehydroquinate dehydratase n=1 Tax=Taibaiella helva TaxID=2301235 RepID=UPI000E592FD1|nr:type II 3-dehydroquinate dehydratase [Taibaiella helva]